jgi:predicted transcriptional regulator
MEIQASKFETYLKEVKKTKKEFICKPHDALQHFNAGRRGVHVSAGIRRLLQKYDVISTPDITTCWVYSDVTLSARPTIGINAGGKIAEDFDPIPRLNELDAAEGKGKGLISVYPDTTIKEALTIMQLHDFSQLPVMTSEREVKGMISWKSIGSHALGSDKSIKASSCMVEVHVLDYDISLFDAAKVIQEKEVVLVRKPDKTISGIVTVTDLAEQFVSMAGPFLLIEQIEKHLRKLLDGKFSEDELQKFTNPANQVLPIGVLSDLSFGDYVNIIANPEMFEKLELSIERAPLIERLGAVRKIRNDVMHFNPEPISDEDLELLRLTIKFFDTIQK